MKLGGQKCLKWNPECFCGRCQAEFLLNAHSLSERRSLDSVFDFMYEFIHTSVSLTGTYTFSVHKFFWGCVFSACYLSECEHQWILEVIEDDSPHMIRCSQINYRVSLPKAVLTVRSPITVPLPPSHAEHKDCHHWEVQEFSQTCTPMLRFTYLQWCQNILMFLHTCTHVFFDALLFSFFLHLPLYGPFLFPSLCLTQNMGPFQTWILH